MSKTKADIITPILVLTIICLVASAALALTNSLTQPVIEQAAALRADEVRIAVMPGAKGFEKIEVAGIPTTVAEVYRETSGEGYVFTVLSKGYGGDITILCGIGPDGRITACMALSHTETVGIGSKIDTEEYRGQYTWQDASLNGVSAISGATVSSKAYERAIRDVFLAYDAAKEAAS